MPATRDRWRNRLPHWEVRDQPHFITIRCAKSLPLEAVEKIKEIHATLQSITPSSRQFVNLQRQYFLTCEKFLDRALGVQPFHNPAACEIAISALTDLESTHGWLAQHYVVMPNHVHFILKATSPAAKRLRDGICHFKGRVARQANLVLGRQGAFWQTDWFDRWLRNDDEVKRVIEYIHNNPVKAGLVKSWENFAWVK